MIYLATEDICKFLPAEEYKQDLQFFHFVYEASYKRLRQPFIYKNYYAFLAFKGNATLSINGREYSITPGTLFFTQPEQLFTLTGDPSFTYLYITFNGRDAAAFLESFGISRESCVYPGLGHLLDFWITSIRRINDFNAAILTRSVLLHTLSYITSPADCESQTDTRFEKILSYIHHQYTDPSLSISKIADMFFYNKKYLSSLFVKKTGVHFSEYLNQLKIQQAELLMKQPDLSISVIAAKCGFTNASYFSKVFKDAKGCSPQEYIKKHVSPLSET